MTRKQRRLSLVGAAGVALTIAAALVLVAMEDRIVFARTPTELVSEASPGYAVRLGGLVEEGSVRRDADTVKVHFRVTDTASSVPVVYGGILPDLFREGQGVVVEGLVGEDGTLMADTVLARHDENYVPKEVADALKEQGVWKGAGAALGKED